ncbi:LuxR C-terminal-related transcriptional regulator [Enterobacillus tribolii]|uniref:DNA-binding NarL/FixJ family response regulator n=1 Tax=Enterobacillus tribolii TaxID=1487935 RepID=A0A370QP43_9GAMM|nr:LuxR C-terminal-related transcriptional regulator [Enterobacillus tribolii]MBW7981902.1 response regulator transcription factor [Enterobacillus tribolii]RDK90078.1 DNA-binding NarL/FixJ family response regulator [Enterobacillus tribolii]
MSHMTKTPAVREPITAGTALKTALKIVVLEPADIRWLGIQQILRDAGVAESGLQRIRSADVLSETLHSQRPDILLLSSVSGNTVSLLSTLLTLRTACPRSCVMAILHKEAPYLRELLQGFGVDQILTTPTLVAELPGLLSAHSQMQHLRSVAPRFTRQECYVMQALLAGYSVSQVARTQGKNIRTVSAQKQSVLGKMKMMHSGELQVLGGYLMTAEAGR